MPVEFIGMISTRDQSEIRRSRGPVVDRDYVQRLRPRSRGRRLRPRAHRLQLVPAGRDAGRRVRREPHGPAELPDRAPSRVRGADPRGPHVCHPRPVHRRPDRRAHHHRRQRRRAAPRRRLPAQGRALRPHRRVPRHPQAGRGPRTRRSATRAGTTRSRTSTPRSARRSSRDPAVLRRLLGTGVPGRRQARGRLRPVGRAARRDGRADRLGPGLRRGGRPDRYAPGSASRSGPSSARPRNSPGSGRTRSSPTTPGEHRGIPRPVAPVPAAARSRRTGAPSACWPRRPRASCTTGPCGPRWPPPPAPPGTPPLWSGRRRRWPRLCSTTSTSA